MKHGMTIRANRNKNFARIYIMLYSVKGGNKINMVYMDKTLSYFSVHGFKIYAAYLARTTIMR